MAFFFRFFTINPIIQDEIDDMYYNHEQWLKNCWEWSFNQIKIKNKYDMGNCNECEHFMIDNIECKVHSYEEQEKAYSWDALKEAKLKDTANMICNLFSEYVDNIIY